MADLVTAQTANVVAVCEESSANVAAASAECLASDQSGRCCSCQSSLFRFRLFGRRIVVGPTMLMPIVADTTLVKVVSADNAAVTKTSVQDRPPIGDWPSTWLLCTHLIPPLFYERTDLANSEKLSLCFKKSIHY